MKILVSFCTNFDQFKNVIHESQFDNIKIWKHEPSSSSKNYLSSLLSSSFSWKNYIKIIYISFYFLSLFFYLKFLQITIETFEKYDLRNHRDNIA